MEIIMVGLSHRTAPPHIRELVAFSSDQLTDALALLNQQFREATILSTCHRTEIYVLADRKHIGHEKVISFLEDFHQTQPHIFRPYLCCLAGREAVKHLFKVASGIESMIIGEPQILSQVKHAHQIAAKQKAISKIFYALFRYAIHTGKTARASTQLGQMGLSTSHAAIALAEGALLPRQLQDIRSLVIGAGNTGELLVSLMIRAGVKDIYIANRTPENAETLAKSVNGVALGLGEIVPLLPELDLIISATESNKVLLTASVFEKARRNTGTSRLIIVDLGMPRNIDPQLTEFDNVVLYNLDDLNLVVQQQGLLTDEEVERISNIVDREADRYQAWLRSLEMTPTIVALRSRFKDIYQKEMDRHVSKIGDLSASQYEALDMLIISIMNKFLHEPTLRLKEYGGQPEGRIITDALQDLFALDLEPDVQKGD